MQALAHAHEPVARRVGGADGRDGPARAADDDGVAGTQRLPVFAVEGAPHLGAAVHGHLLNESLDMVLNKGLNKRLGKGVGQGLDKRLTIFAVKGAPLLGMAVHGHRLNEGLGRVLDMVFDEGLIKGLDKWLAVLSVKQAPHLGAAIHRHLLDEGVERGVLNKVVGKVCRMSWWTRCCT